MKILPDYMIQYMPDIEAAIEELRLSVMDHAYEMLECLDIDELTSDDIRKKLELYDIKVENMSESWLPNGRFYRIYPSIKHNRTTYQSIQSIVKSGGQFEGLWSYDFSSKAEYNYKKLQLLRHYELKSADDGYFYISGDALQDSYGRSVSATLVALSSDILLYQAIPAGYTYLYIPWLRPHYPSDSDYFYNVHMLDYDRLHYPQYDEENKGSYKLYSTKHPASLNYYNKDLYYTRTPYWIDYHYIGNGLYLSNTDDLPNSTWPIEESGTYIDAEGFPVDPQNAVAFKLDDSCKELENSNAILPTNFYIKERLSSSSPNINQLFTPLELDSSGSPTIQYTTDESHYIEDGIDKYNPKIPKVYRFDLLAKDYTFKLRESILNIKAFRPMWCEESPIFDMMQSPFIGDSGSKRSLLHWIEVGQINNVPRLLADQEHPFSDYSSFNAESIVRDNIPSVSSITCTSLSRPTISHLDTVYVGYLNPFFEDEGDDDLLAICGTLSTDSSTEVRVVLPDTITLGEVFYRSGELLYSIIPQSGVVELDSSEPEDPAIEIPYNSLIVVDENGDITSDIDSSMLSYSLASMSIDDLSNIQSLELETTTLSDSQVLIVPDEDQLDSINNVRSLRSSMTRSTNTLHVLPEVSSAGIYQGDNVEVTNTSAGKRIYYYHEDSPISYDPSLYYTIISASQKCGDTQNDIEDSESIIYLEGDPITRNLRAKYIGADPVKINYITYKTSNIHKLWFSSDKRDTLCDSVKLLFNRCGNNNIYHFSSNTVSIICHVVGVYDYNDNKVEYDRANVQCVVKVDGTSRKYAVISSSITNKGVPVKASYILFTVEISTGSVDEEYDTVVNCTNGVAFDIHTLETTSLGTITYVDYSRNDFFVIDSQTQDILLKSSDRLYNYSTALNVIHDDVALYHSNITIIEDEIVSISCGVNVITDSPIYIFEENN